MSRIIRLLIKNSLHQNKNREIRYLPDLSIVNLLSVFVLVQKFLNYYPNYPTHRIYCGEDETLNPFMPTVQTFAVQETDVSRHNGGTIMRFAVREMSVSWRANV